MITRDVTTTIDPDKCIGCAACVRVCPCDTLEIVNGTCEVSGDQSLSCGHCAAICPENAITVSALDPEMLQFSSFQIDHTWLCPGTFPVADLAGLLASKRSCRNFKDTPVSVDILNDLVKLGCLAPSGTNSQQWTYTCLTTRDKVLGLAKQVRTFFEDLNKKAKNPMLRVGLKFFGMPQLDNYFKDYYESVTQAIDQFKQQNRDRLFHGACASIIIGSGPGASCPKEDALLAAGNILTGAHAMGLGTCLIGFAVAAMNQDKRIKKHMGLGDDETVHAVIALGYPDESYKRITGRRRPVIRFH